MKCPECGNEMREGFVEAGTAGSLTDSSTVVNWYPEEDKGRMFKKHPVRLRIYGKGWHCYECMKVIAEFEEK